MKIKPRFVRPDWLKARSNKTDISFMVFILIFLENCLYYDAMHNFSVWLRTGYIPADINRFRSDAGNVCILVCI